MARMPGRREAGHSSGPSLPPQRGPDGAGTQCLRPLSRGEGERAPQGSGTQGGTSQGREGVQKAASRAGPVSGAHVTEPSKPDTK